MDLSFPLGEGPSNGLEERRRWYVLRSKPRAERQAASVLQARQLTVYLPLLKRRARQEPLFPSYLFLKIDATSDELLVSRSAHGVSYILNNEGAPLPVEESLVEGIQERLAYENSLRPGERFSHGERVWVTGGPFAELEAIFDRALSPQGRCLVLLEMLGRLTRVQVDARYLTNTAA